MALTFESGMILTLLRSRILTLFITISRLIDAPQVNHEAGADLSPRDD